MDIQDIDTVRAWVDVDLGALVANYRSLEERANPRVGMLPIVKADAYGLGVRGVLQALEPLEPWGYGVAALSEARALRELGIARRILLLFPTLEELRAAVELEVTPAIGDPATLVRWRELARQADRRLSFHLEVDTGMGRAGFLSTEVERWLPEVLEAAAEVEWEGTFTHFHSAEVEDERPTREQWERFRACIGRFPNGSGGLLHASGTAAALRWPDYSLDLVRPGIFLYGARVVTGLPAPRPVAAVRARVTALKDVPAGWTASYGATFRSSSASRWATLALGYGDGLRRELSNRGSALFGDEVAPIIGRVCMDVTVVDVTDLEGVEPGSVATVVGGDPAGPASLEMVAELCGTIPYEILTGLTGRLPRLYAPARSGSGARSGGAAGEREGYGGP